MDQLAQIAQTCTEYDSIGLAQGYGVSLANVSGKEDPRCDCCLYWAQGDCDIFNNKVNNWNKQLRL